MTTDKKTLADVQPGGRVRLTTVLYDRAHDLLGDAYNAGTHGIGYSQQAMELHDAIIPTQPSPAGQDALAEAARRVISDIDSGDFHGEISEATYAALEAALAARQPVGEPVAYLDLGAGGYLDVGTDLSDEELAALPKGRHMLGIIGTHGVDGYKPAQAVDLEQFRPAVRALGLYAEEPEDVDEAKRLMALIDSQAVGNG